MIEYEFNSYAMNLIALKTTVLKVIFYVLKMISKINSNFKMIVLE